jgi:hypothetical protein
MLLAACASSGRQAPSPVGTGAPVLDVPTVAYPFDRETLRRPDIEVCASHLVKMTGYGHRQYERAAFLILRDDGMFDCSVWPATFKARSESWSGSIPKGTAAIIHTHPLESPGPSYHDVLEAARIGVPIIVATPDVLAMAQPRGDVITMRSRI